MNKTEGYAIDGDDMHWRAECPTCGSSYEYTGYFDSGEVEHCRKCGTDFKITKVWIDDKHYIV